MPELGSTCRCNVAPHHIWVVISDPQRNQNQVVLVNLTALRDDCVDDVCILEPDDYPGVLRHTTTVAYSKHNIGNVRGLKLLVDQGQFTALPDLPSETLDKIIQGALQSNEIGEIPKSLIQPA